MNKPEKYRHIIKVDESYCEKLLEIFDRDYNSNHNQYYGRPDFFKKVDCDFTINRFKVESTSKFESFKKESGFLFEKIEELYGPGKFCNIQIAKMKGGGKILPHIDSGLFFVLSHRIHIPLITNENVIFTIDNEDFYFKSQNVYEINNLKEHSVVNNNPESFNRIHLVLDYVSSEYEPFIEPKPKKLTLSYQ